MKEREEKGRLRTWEERLKQPYKRVTAEQVLRTGTKKTYPEKVIIIHCSFLLNLVPHPELDKKCTRPFGAVEEEKLRDPFPAWRRGISLRSASLCHEC